MALASFTHRIKIRIRKNNNNNNKNNNNNNNNNDDDDADDDDHNDFDDIVNDHDISNVITTTGPKLETATTTVATTKNPSFQCG